MPELFSKPPEFRPGHQISMEAVNQLLRAIPRVVTGDGVQMKKIGDRWIVQQETPYVHQSENVRSLIVISEQKDYLTCVLFSFSSNIQVYSESLGTDLQARGLTGSVVLVAKPQWLQQTPYVGIGNILVNGEYVNFTYTGNNTRIFNVVAGASRNEQITPSYFPGDIITAVAGPTGYAVDEVPIVWSDLNTAARMWVAPFVAEASSAYFLDLFIPNWANFGYSHNIDSSEVLVDVKDSLDVRASLSFTPTGFPSDIYQIKAYLDSLMVFSSGEFLVDTSSDYLQFVTEIHMILCRFSSTVVVIPFASMLADINAISPTGLRPLPQMGMMPVSVGGGINASWNSGAVKLFSFELFVNGVKRAGLASSATVRAVAISAP